MKKTLTIILSLFFAFGAFAQSNFGKIQGKVTDAKTKAPIAYATLMVEKEGIRKGGAYTDENGKYSIPALDPGDYSITVTYVDYKDQKVTGIEVSANSTKFLNIELTQKGADDAQQIGPVVIRAGKPLIEKDKNQQTLTSSDITKLPTRSLNAIAATTSGVNQTSAGISFIGSRADGTAYFVDGVRVVGSTGVMQSSQAQIDIIQSGIPAQYGDFTGGAISITTKGPSRFLNRTFEMISSSPFDPYHFNQVEFSAVGPLWVKNKGGGEKEYVALGYQFAANANYTADASPAYGGLYRVKDDVLADIEANPLTRNPNGPGLIPTSSLLTKEDLVLERARKNVGQFFGNVQGKLEYQPSKNSTLTLFGSYNNNQGTNFQTTQYLMNWKEFSMGTSETLRTYLKFTQRLGDNQSQEGKEKKLFTDAYYNIRLDYTSTKGETQNPTHRDNFFDYGYLGRFTSFRQPFYQYVNDPTWHVDQNGDTVSRKGYYNLAGFFNSSIEFEPSGLNEFRSNYTQNFFDNAEAQGQTVFTNQQIQQGLGLLNGFNAGSTYGLWSNPGTVSYFYSKTQYERAAAYAQGEATLNLENTHDLQFGMYFEQTFASRWAVGANQLWTLMPQLANRHLANLNTITENGYVIGGIHSYDEFGTFTDTVNYNVRIDRDQQSTFDRNLRQRLIEQGRTDAFGNPITESSFIDINSLSPEDFSLDMFSADDLWNNGNTYIAYYGYDYLGNRDRRAFGLEDFTNDSLNRRLGSFAPVYSAIWFQDKFQFKDLILRLGVRVERYDANQDVLKDDYSLFPTNSVAEVRSLDGGSGRGSNLLANYDIPATVGDDYVVYVDNIDNPNEILGYRNGAQWFDANGNELANPDVLAQNSTSGRIQPFLVDAEERLVPESFQDYEPVFNVLPRVWFSFPINSEAQFFANYDVLAQRPTDGAIFTPYNQFYFLEANQGGGLANGALRPRITTNYEIGFKQVLSANSALSLIASYRESRGDFALVRVNQAYPISYNSYSNIDFSTVKNFRAEYELRGQGRTSLFFNYALLFSDGTGSNINSSAALIAANLPNLRSLYPTQYDVRHQMTLRLDYRFKPESQYTGPIWFGKKIFANSGANFIISSKSGEPYTAYVNPIATVQAAAQRQILDGNPFGSRMPWQFKVDANFNKSFEIKKGRAKDFRRQSTEVNVFFWVQNLLNSRIVNRVYGFTGLPDDDGWLSSPEGQQQSANELNTQSYIDLYNVRVSNPYNFLTPRLARLGVRLSF